MHTEEEHRKLLCPHMAVAVMMAAQQGHGLGNGSPTCFGSECAMWRWAGKTQPGVRAQDALQLGFCGLAGRPET